MSAQPPAPDLSGDGLRIATVVARFNEHITGRLLDGAAAAAVRHGVATHDVFWVPGAFELPLVALVLARTGRYDAVVCLGAVVRHDTDHYVHVAGGAATGIQRAGLDTGVPCIFGVLTCDTDEQALARAGGSHSDSGGKAMETAIETANLLRRLA
jgi:6,7-dimethyl-8-ribityllumazine synthase